MRMRLRRMCLCLRWRRQITVSLRSFIRNSILKPAGDSQFPPADLYHYQHAPSNGKSSVHLRVEKDNTGVLLVNASRIYHLNQTAAYMTYNLMKQVDETAIVTGLIDTYQIAGKKAAEELRSFKNIFYQMINPDEHCPVCDFNIDITSPFSHMPSAPYRMDLALTYRCNNLCHHCYNDRTRIIKELDLDGWKKVLDTVWQQGIPHVVFTGGEPTLIDFLPELIAYAQNKGLVTGMNTNGRRLKDANYVTSLVDAGLDHVQITLESHRESIHNEMVANDKAWQQTVAGIKNALASNLFVMTNTTLLTPNMAYLDDLLNFLADLGVKTVGLNALIYSGAGLDVQTGFSEENLPAILDKAKIICEQNNTRLIWYTPTQYCHFNPIQMDLGVKGCTAALYNMCIEPNGDVLPCQSYYEPLGNILSNDWESIWKHPLAVDLRERKSVPFECLSCELLNECGGGCPLARKAHKTVRQKPVYSPI